MLRIDVLHFFTFTLNKRIIFVFVHNHANEQKYSPNLLLLLCKTPDLSGGGYSYID